MSTFDQKKLIEKKLKVTISLMQSKMADSMDEFISFINKVNFDNPTENLAIEYEQIILQDNCPLSRAELRVLEFWANHDLDINTCADRLHISHVTAHQHIAKARAKLDVKHNQSLFKKAIQNGWIILRDSDGKSIPVYKSKTY